ncbi:rhomboid-domain-containing protein [Rickenella mellea]|uniref:Rhomboid-type serine protease n=1 Tax=Rickenella mellea TaxID=50990 RepID=A0A4Y7QMC8_9AGAM|nr:rhomboid-domain-containing protein [Rickenella mellea]
MSAHSPLPRFEQRPVNFGDEEYTYDTQERSTNRPSLDATSRLTHQTSGIPVPDSSMRKNEFGQTEAEALASEYRSSPSSSRNSQPPGNFDRLSSFSQHRKSVASNLDALTYIDEEFNYYPSQPTPQTSDDRSLIINAADIGRSGSSPAIQEFEYQDPYKPGDVAEIPENKGLLSRIVADGQYLLEQRIEDKKRGIGRQKHPFVCWALTIVMVSIVIYELVVNSREQGSPVSFKPVVNPMLGPSQSALIKLGARFPPCMKIVTDVPVTLQLPCLNDTANPPDRTCPISDLCGFGGIHNNDPNQWFRFITPIFLHAGIVHLALNMLAQLLVSAQIEREMGSGGFLITYFAAGIFGNVLGGNFALVGIPSVGASGAIFGTVAVSWVDLFAHWRYQYRPVVKLVIMSVELVIGVALGYIPYVDNFVHLGGFLMGLLVGTTFYPVISVTRRHKTIMWIFRLVAIPIAVVLYVVLVRNFYSSDPYAACKGCRYLSCIPTAANNHCQGTGITTTTTTSFRRSFL